MNFKKYHVSKNLFDKTVATLNYYVNSSTGDIVGNSSYFASDYIEVEQGEEYYWNDAQRGNAGAFYDSNKTYISGWSSSQTRYVFTVPSGAKYVRLTGEKADIDAYMLSKGSEALPYEPYSSEVWQDIPYYLHNTSTDTITTLPADIYANAATATVGLKGQTVQNGTPTPQNPVMPNGTGERTGNHFNAEKVVAGRLDNGVIGYVSDTSNVHYSNNVLSFTTSKAYRGVTSDLIPINDAMRISYTLSSEMIKKVAWYASDKSFISQTEHNSWTYNKGMILTPIENAKYFRISFEPNAAGDFTITNVMLNDGETALPYEPYGVKIPISSANTTTPVYLGEVQSTRRVKKLVLTGGDDENWLERATFDDASAYSFNGLTDKSVSYTVAQAVCTHFPYLASYADQSDHFYQDANNVYFTSTQYRTLTDWKAYLAAQYAAGTPVTVWYVLATEETAVVNEPLMRIGDYADEVTNVSIPVTAGGDTISVGTTVQPSEVTANYKGWHPVQNVHERTNGAWT